MKVLSVLLCIVAVAIATNEGLRGNGSKNRQKKLLVGQYSTRTVISLTTFTSLVPKTCVNVVNPVACKKRRQLRIKNIRKMTMNDNDQKQSSLKEELADVIEPSMPRTLTERVGNSMRQGRIKITFWSTVTSSYTLVSTSLNANSLFSVSFFCSIAGYSYPPVCG